MTSAPSEFKSNGGGAVSCVEETGTLPLECLFDIVPDGDTYLIKSAKFVNAYLRFDGHGGDGFSSNGFGTVNAQFGHQTWEQYNFLAAED
jgi:hypothetical protein